MRVVLNYGDMFMRREHIDTGVHSARPDSVITRSAPLIQFLLITARTLFFISCCSQLRYKNLWLFAT